jgi:hypothetical protein
VADVNHNGRPDLLVANAGSNSVSVLLGNGNGTFAAAQNFATGTSPEAVAVADLNGDGKPDLIVANDGSSSVSVLLGNANGTFLNAVNFAVGSGPSSVAVADVNGDGTPDLIVANYGSNRGSVLENNRAPSGTGTFPGRQDFGVGLSPRSVAVADVNGDGRPDLVVANGGSNSVSVLLGNGNGTFQSAVNYGVGSSPFSVAVADVNGDGRPDLVVANYDSNGVSVLLGNGNGTFQSAVNFGVGSYPLSVAVADVNGDGRPDLVTANDSGPYNGPGVSLLLGNRNAATQLQITAPASVTAGTSFTITVTALTAGNGLDGLYTGTVHFSSSDGLAGLPANYTFTKADMGSHTFSVTLNSTGTQTVTVKDKAHKTIEGTASVTVNSAGAPPPTNDGAGREAAISSVSADASLSALRVATALDGVSLVGAPSDSGLAATGRTSPPRQGADAPAPAVVSNTQPGPSASAPHRLAARAAIDQVFADQNDSTFSDALRKDEVPAWLDWHLPAHERGLRDPVAVWQ